MGLDAFVQLSSSNSGRFDVGTFKYVLEEASLFHFLPESELPLTLNLLLSRTEDLDVLSFKKR